MRYFVLLLTLTIIGCSVTRSMDVKISGDNVKSPYASGDLNLEYKANTTYGFGSR